MEKLNSIQVLLVDDHAVVRAGYRMLLQNSPDIEIIAEAENGEGAYEQFIKYRPDVVIMDLSLPGIGGLEAIRRITSRDSTARILVFSMHEDITFVEQALNAGAKGYITKSSAPDTLVEAINEISNGNIYLDHGLAQQLAVHHTRGRENLFAELSNREFEIFCLLAEGLSTAKIATKLSLSYKTVANYSTQIKNKLKVRNSAELVHLAVRHGVVKI